MVRGYSELIDTIGNIFENRRKQAYQAVNSILVRTYWEIGRQIVEYEQKGREKAEYGSRLLENLSKDLRIKCGRGFSRRNILDMRRFYLHYQNWQTVSAELTWSHYVSLLDIRSTVERSFYKKQCILERWSVRELERQINSALFYRFAYRKDKRAILQLAKKGHIIAEERDIIKDPYILEFLNLPESRKFTEKVLEQKIIDNMQMFLLELGKGFAFVGRQHRITFGNNHYYVDLVFYHKVLKCHVLIDLKIGKADHSDIGQMNMYLNYFMAEESSNDNPPIGIILSTQKNEVMVKYALGGISNKMFVSRYRLYLPSKEKLEEELRRLL